MLHDHMGEKQKGTQAQERKEEGWARFVTATLGITTHHCEKRMNSFSLPNHLFKVPPTNPTTMTNSNISFGEENNHTQSIAAILFPFPSNLYSLLLYFIMCCPSSERPSLATLSGIAALPCLPPRYILLRGVYSYRMFDHWQSSLTDCKHSVFFTALCPEPGQSLQQELLNAQISFCCCCCLKKERKKIF